LRGHARFIFVLTVVLNWQQCIDSMFKKSSKISNPTLFGGLTQQYSWAKLRAFNDDFIGTNDIAINKYNPYYQWFFWCVRGV
jgi:hypothetical protein